MMGQLRVKKHHQTVWEIRSTPPQLWCRESKDRMQKLSPGHTFLESNYGIGMPKMHPVLTLSAGGHNKSSRKSARSAYHLPPLTWVCITAGDSLIPRTITTREPGKYSLGFLASATQVGTRALVSHVHQRSYGGNSSFFYKRDWWAQFQHISNPLVNTEGELVSQALRQRCHPSPVIWGIAYGI